MIQRRKSLCARKSSLSLQGVKNFPGTVWDSFYTGVAAMIGAMRRYQKSPTQRPG